VFFVAATLRRTPPGIDGVSPAEEGWIGDAITAAKSAIAALTRKARQRMVGLPITLESLVNGEADDFIYF
jgi:hypothetical protein